MSYREPGVDNPLLLLVALNGRMLALHRETGVIAWEQVLGRMGGTVELASIGELVFAVTAQGMLHRIDYQSGELLSSKQLPGTYRGRATMVVDGGMLYVAAGGEITCVDRDGEVRWFNGLKGKGVGATALGFPGNLRQADADR